MTSIQQREQLQSQIWKIANEVRGAVDGWDFKQYVLGTLFYRFISENFANYIEAGDENINYAKLQDNQMTEDIVSDSVRTKGYFIYPSQLFCNVANTHSISPISSNSLPPNIVSAKFIEAVSTLFSDHDLLTSPPHFFFFFPTV